MKREKNCDDQLSKDEKQPVDCPPDCQKAESKEDQTGKWDSVKEECKGHSSLSEQRTMLLHAIFQNLDGDRALNYELMSNFLLKRNTRFQQKILDLLPALTLETLYDFQEFSRFVKTFLSRAQYQCNSMLYHFLSVTTKKLDPLMCADVLIGTLFTEIESVNDAIAISSTIKDANREYEWWLSANVLEEEAP